MPWTRPTLPAPDGYLTPTTDPDVIIPRLPWGIDQTGQVRLMPVELEKVYPVVEWLLNPDNYATSHYAQIGVRVDQMEVIAGALLVGHVTLGQYPSVPGLDGGIGYEPFSTTSGLGGAGALCRRCNTLYDLITERMGRDVAPGK